MTRFHFDTNQRSISTLLSCQGGDFASGLGNDLVGEMDGEKGAGGTCLGAFLLLLVHSFAVTYWNNECLCNGVSLPECQVCAYVRAAVAVAIMSIIVPRARVCRQWDRSGCDPSMAQHIFNTIGSVPGLLSSARDLVQLAKAWSEELEASSSDFKASSSVSKASVKGADCLGLCL